MACQPTPVSTLFSASTQYTTTTLTSSSLVTYTPSPQTSQWAVTSCNTEQSSSHEPTSTTGDGRHTDISSTEDSSSRRHQSTSTMSVPTQVLAIGVIQKNVSRPTVTQTTTVTLVHIEAASTRHAKRTGRRHGWWDKRIRAEVENLLPRPRQWWDAQDTQRRCETNTMTTTELYDPTSSWSTFYVTSTGQSVMSVPVKTVWSECEATASVDNGQASASSTSSVTTSVQLQSSTETSTTSQTSAPTSSKPVTLSPTPTPTSSQTIHSSTTPPLSTTMNATTASVSSPVPLESASESHPNKAVSTGAAVGGVIGLFAFLALCLFIMRWWKKRNRVQKTEAIRSSWFYGGDVRESKMEVMSEKESRNEYPFGGQDPQSRFSAPSLLSRHSLAMPAFIARPITHMRQGSGRFPPILSLKHLRSSIFNRSDEPGAYNGKKNLESSQAWADKYTFPVPAIARGEEFQQKMNPPRALMMDPHSSSQDDRQHPGSFATLAHSQELPSRLDNLPVEWGSSYANSQRLSTQAFPSEYQNASQFSFHDANGNVPSEASQSMYSLPSTHTAHNLSRGSTLKSVQSDGSTPGEVVSSFPIPPSRLKGSLPPPPLPEIPTSRTFSPDFTRDLSLPQPYNSRLTQSTSHSSGVWEYAGYAGGSSPGPSAAQQVNLREEDRVTRDWYNKPIWDGDSTFDPTSVYGPPGDLQGGPADVKGRKSVKSVRWDDQGGSGPKVL
ncbi:hypothetical protein L204_100402 [Cryptococcus depauperatus]|nr:hypothetical protein L204_02115 [Cryptococcus depauperatus CBS 7855]